MAYPAGIQALLGFTKAICFVWHDFIEIVLHYACFSGNTWYQLYPHVISAYAHNLAQCVDKDYTRMMFQL